MSLCRLSIAVCCCSILLCSCSKDSPTVSTHLPPSGPALAITSVLPDPALIGQRVIIEGEGFDTTYFRRNQVFFNGVETELDSGSSTRLFCPVPLGARSGPVMVVTPAQRVSWPVFTVSLECSEQLCTVWNNAGVIDSTDAIAYGMFREPYRWQIAVTHDTVSLVRVRSVGDDSSVMERLRFRHVSDGVLPVYMDGIVTVLNAVPPSTYRDTLDHGLMRIQEWNLHKRVCGWFFGEREIVFWVDIPS